MGVWDSVRLSIKLEVDSGFVKQSTGKVEETRGASTSSCWSNAPHATLRHKLTNAVIAFVKLYQRREHHVCVRFYKSWQHDITKRGGEALPLNVWKPFFYSQTFLVCWFVWGVTVCSALLHRLFSLFSSSCCLVPTPQFHSSIFNYDTFALMKLLWNIRGHKLDIYVDVFWKHCVLCTLCKYCECLILFI